MQTTFDDLPDDARTWVFTTSRALTTVEQADLTARLTGFIDRWTSHARPVEAAAEIRAARFIVVAARIPGGDVSGCGTDKLFRVIEDTLAGFDVALAPALSVAYEAADGTVQVVGRSDFRELVATQCLPPETPVFNPAIDSMRLLRGGAWRQPACETWLSRYFPGPGAHSDLPSR